MDIIRGYRQKMAIMDLVYPITALYWGPVTLWFYFRHGRRKSKPVIEKVGEPEPDSLPRWNILGNAISQCGAGCTLGDISGEWLVVSLGPTIAGESLLADYPMDFAWAWTLGIVFQYFTIYFTIAPMRETGKVKGIWAAIRADTLSILAFQAGLFGGMAVYQKLIWPPAAQGHGHLLDDDAARDDPRLLHRLAGHSWLITKGVTEKM